VNSTYDMSDINLLSEWEDMGIAYADDFQGKYWGVINHENQEGVFRVSENIETKGVKLWTWGRNNVDNDMFDFSNGGADNYIELWGGVSESFFTDATIGANENKNWKESYCPTVNLSAICNMNNYGGVNLIWDNEKSQVTYELNTFHSNEAYTVKLRIDGNGRDEEFANESIDFEALGRIKNFSLEGLNLSSGTYTIHFDLLDKNNKVALATSKSIETGSVSSRDDLASAKPLDIELRALGNRKMYAQFPETGKHDVEVYSLDGKLLSSHEFTGSSLAIQLPCSGLYFIAIEESNKLFMQKIFVY